MAGDGSSGVLDGLNFLRGLGVAPGAQLVEQLYNPWHTQPDGMLLLMRESLSNGAFLSGNSWGPSGTPKGTTATRCRWTPACADADPNTPGNSRSHTYCQS